MQRGKYEKTPEKSVSTPKTRQVKKPTARKGEKRSNVGTGQWWAHVLLSVVLIFGLCAWWFISSRPDPGEGGGTTGTEPHFTIQIQRPTAPSGTAPMEGTTAPVEDTEMGYSVSSSNSYATAAGVAILEAGGNAVDAAIAISYTLGVAEPYASGMGGGGCMVIYDPVTEKFTFYNYGAEVPQSRKSWLSLVPGFVSGMEAVRQDFGTMDYNVLLQPAMQACDGVVIDSIGAYRIRNASQYLSTSSPFYGKNGFLEEGDTLVQQELKKTLQRLANEGADSFYTGSIAQDIVNNTKLTMGDLAAYETIKSEAVVGTYREYTIGAAAAPFSGITLIQMLKMAEALDIPSPAEDNGGFLDDLYEMSQKSQYERLRNVYDLRFGSGVNQNEMVTDAYIAKMLNMDIGDFDEEEECEDTTGFTVIDRNGLTVACTNTLSSFFGCKTSVDGFFMNNTGYLFGSGVNTYETGKRPRTHISPAILVSDDEIIAVASPGGNLITKILANVLLDIVEFGEEPQTAIDKQRVVFLYGDVLYYEVGYDTPPLAQASGYGYPVVPYSWHPYFGNVALSGYRTDTGFYATRDVRRCGNGASYNEP